MWCASYKVQIPKLLRGVPRKTFKFKGFLVGYHVTSSDVNVYGGLPRKAFRLLRFLVGVA